MHHSSILPYLPTFLSIALVSCLVFQIIILHQRWGSNAKLDTLLVRICNSDQLCKGFAIPIWTIPPYSHTSILFFHCAGIEDGIPNHNPTPALKSIFFLFTPGSTRGYSQFDPFGVMLGLISNSLSAEPTSILPYLPTSLLPAPAGPNLQFGPTKQGICNPKTPQACYRFSIDPKDCPNS